MLDPCQLFGLWPLRSPNPFLSFHHVWTPGLDYGTFQSNGLKLVYETQGNGSEVVIVVHGGAGLPHEYFHPMLYNLSRYAKLVFFDRRADMLSTRTGQGMASIEEMSDDIDALRKELGLERVTAAWAQLRGDDRSQLCAPASG